MTSRARIYKLRQRKIADLNIQRFILPLAIIGIALLWASAPTMKMLKERSLNEGLQSQLQQKTTRNKELSSEIKKLRTNSYIELKARKNLGLVKPNEIQYYVLMKKDKIKLKKQKAQKAWYEKALDFFETTFTK